MNVSDLTPEEREEIIRDMKEHYPDFELRDDAEIDYFLFPFPKDREVMPIDKAQAIWEAQAQRAASEWKTEPDGELADFLGIVNRGPDFVILSVLPLTEITKSFKFGACACEMRLYIHKG